MSDQDIVAALGKTDLFGSLNERALGRIAATAKRVSHPAGKKITSQGDLGIAFHLILEGSATVNVNGHDVGELSAGDYFGEIALIDGKARSAAVTTKTELTAASIPTWQFLPLLDEVPGLAKALLLVMCERVRKTQDADLTPA